MKRLIYLSMAVMMVLAVSCGKDSPSKHKSQVHVEQIELDPADLYVVVGETSLMTAIFTPYDATNQNLSWTSADETVATVENGVVSGLKKGTVTITAWNRICRIIIGWQMKGLIRGNRCLRQVWLFYLIVTSPPLI